MPIPIWTPGEVLASSDVNSWMVPVWAVKTSDQSVTSSTTLVNDTQLAATLAANATYFFDLALMIVANDTAQFKSQFTGPSGATANFGIMGFNTGAVFGATTRGISSSVVFTGNSTAVVPLWMRGNVQTSGTSGTFQFQWAQNTSNATACTVKSGSQLFLYRTG